MQPNGDQGNTEQVLRRAQDERQVLDFVRGEPFGSAQDRPVEPQGKPTCSASFKGATLLKLARTEIAVKLGHQVDFSIEADWLAEPGASFVTLTRQGELRGCIGTLEAHRPLGVDVRENAVAAAFRDPRFMPLTRVEFDDTRVEVSLLSASEPLIVASEQAALAALRPNIDGVVFEYGQYRSTFLPQVWEQLPEPAEFMAHLKRKAGLPADFWADQVRLSRYTVSKWKEGIHEHS